MLYNSSCGNQLMIWHSNNIQFRVSVSSSDSSLLAKVVSGLQLVCSPASQLSSVCCHVVWIPHPSEAAQLPDRHHQSHSLEQNSTFENRQTNVMPPGVTPQLWSSPGATEITFILPLSLQAKQCIYSLHRYQTPPVTLLEATRTHEGGLQCFYNILADV